MNSETEKPNERKEKVFFDRKKVDVGFIYRVWFVIGAVALAALALVLLWQATEVIFLVFAGLLLAVFLRSVSNWISERTPLSETLSLSLLLVFLTGLTAFGVWFFVTSLQAQFDELFRALPEAFEQVRGYLAQTEIGRRVFEQMPTMQDLNRQSSNLFGRITGYFSTFLGFLVNLAVVLAVGVYFAFDPKMYYQGFLKLIPDSRQKRAREVLDVIYITLGRWIVGRISVMTVNGALTAFGLWLLGVPLPIPLGILTAVFNFIPNIGPVLATVPAVLLALTQGASTAVYVAIFYFVLQGLEAYVLTPLVQQRAVSLPPVMVIAAQLFLGILFGLLGVLLAVPLLAVFYVLVQMLYVEDVLEREIEFEGLKKKEKSEKS